MSFDAETFDSDTFDTGEAPVKKRGMPFSVFKWLGEKVKPEPIEPVEHELVISHERPIIAVHALEMKHQVAVIAPHVIIGKSAIEVSSPLVDVRNLHAIEADHQIKVITIETLMMLNDIANGGALPPGWQRTR